MAKRKTRPAPGQARLGAVVSGHPLFGAEHLRGALVLANVTTEAASGPVWVQIARTGKWLGHPSHPEGVEFTAETFAQVVANFRACPEYTPGPDGKGSQPVVPYDYEHASEMDPTKGSIPESGAPAPGWVLELEVRASAESPDVKELWALTDFGTKARKQIADKEYRWTSVSIWKSARDRTTNEPIGALLTSVALTNHPFIRGMDAIAIAASARARLNVSVWGQAESLEEAVVGMRNAFGLPADAPVETIAAQFERLKTILSAPAPADGVEESGEAAELREQAEHIASRLRELLGLPTLSTLDEVIARGGQLLQAMSLPAASPPTGDPTAMSATNPVLLARLCKIYKLREGSSDEVILAAAEKAEKESSDAGDALDKLIALFGSSDTQGLLSEAGKLVEKAKKADEYLSALTAAQSKLAANDKKEAEAEVAQVAASVLHLDPETAKRVIPTLLSERLAVAGDEAKLADWRKRYPLPTPTQQLLTNPIVAGAHGAQYGGGFTGLGAPGTHVNLSAPGAQTPPAAQSQHPALSYPGRNDIEKCMAYLTDKRPGFKTLAVVDQVHEAGNYLRSGAPILT